MAAPLNTCTTIEQRGVVRFFVSKKYGCSKGYPQRNAAHMGKFEFCRQIVEKSSNIKFHENPSSGNGLTEGQKIMTNLIVTFHNFLEAPNKMETYA
jgi:hypothetical protein